jgi:hypothetical protein
MTVVVEDEAMISACVASSTWPLTVVEASGLEAVTNAVVASAVVLLPAVCVTPIVPVGREGVPVKA